MGQKQYKPMTSSLAGRLRNTNLPFQQGLMPVFESVVNSIQAIEDRGETPPGKIRVEIQRSAQKTFSEAEAKKRGPDPHREITGFIIYDNGIGFNDENLQSFQEFDSLLKANRGCRGIGRIIWLKAFIGAKISSVFMGADGQRHKRTFEFTEMGMTDPTDDIVSEDPGCCVELYGFKKQYQKAVAKTVEAIAKAMLSHCSWYFLRPGGAPDIEIVDDDERIVLQDLFDTMMGSKDDCSAENLYIDGREFNITHIKMRTRQMDISHSLYLCAGERLVQVVPVKGKLPGLFDKISDENGSFTYACYVSGKYLDENVRPERTSFDIPLTTDDSGLFAQNAEISLDKIIGSVLAQTKCYLGEALTQNESASKERLTKFVNYQAPRYRSIVKHLSENERYIDPTISDRELELSLHKRLMELEADLIREGHDILKPQINDSFSTYSLRLKSYMEKSKDIKESDLANYVFHRRIILDILKKAISCDPQTGKYPREDIIHQIIMPMQNDSGEIHSDNANLWVIDERLAFHEYLASDLPIKSMPITDSCSKKEPDICVLDLYDNPLLVNPPAQNYCPASLTIIEFKRPMRNDAKSGAEEDPIEQALTYLQEIRDGQAKTAAGRPINNAQNIPGFCYILSDLTPSVVKRAKLIGLSETPDKMGFFGYNSNYSAYIEVISFDKLLLDANKRNSAFFEKLGLPTV
ncbi:MAG: hypothetical protein MJ033_01805 [Victivallaceae bacterium]|nr:hypothetical protein [Victivallaceae bacterium]